MVGEEGTSRSIADGAAFPGACHRVWWAALTQWAGHCLCIGPLLGVMRTRLCLVGLDTGQAG